MRELRAGKVHGSTAKQESARGGATRTPPRYGVAVVDAPQVQFEASSEPARGPTSAAIADIAARGFAGQGGPLPHFDAVQRAFGRHDLSHVRAHTDGAAAASAAAIGARAYTFGSQVAFRGAPSLHTAAHEAAHVIQQAAGVRLAGGMGRVGDRYEMHADAVADAVVRGESAEPLLDGFVADSGGGELGVQRAVGFEFQTGWGLVRSLPEDPEDPVRVRAEKPRPDKQEDWEDVRVVHKGEVPRERHRAPTRSHGSWQWPWNKSPLTPDKGKWYEVKRELWSPTRTAYITENAAHIAHATKGRTHYKYHKGQVIKDYDGFKMSVDDASTPLGAELEWVVDPPIAESTDVKDVEGLFGRLYEVCKQLLAFQRRESFLLSEVTKDPGDDFVELQPGAKGGTMRDMAANPQATGGVSIDHLFHLFQDLAGSRNNNTQAVKSVRNDLKGSGPARDIVGAIDKIPEKDLMSDRLKGLVGFIVRYVEMAAANTPLAYAKVSTMFLARTDFATMFSLLPKEEKERFEKAPKSLFALVKAALGGKLEETRKVFVGGIKQEGGEPLRPTLTVGEWIYGITEGKDLLSGKYWEAQVKLGGGEEARTYHGMLESMGNLGSKTDTIDTDKELGIIMEFRGNTAPLTVDKWGPYATRIFAYLKALNRGEL